MRNKLFILFWAVLILSISFASAASPALYFSDLIDAPKSGWEQSSTKGAAVTIWGNNFGSSRGSNYVTVNGVQLTSDSDYAEWGVKANNARGMERITFWLNSNMNNGAGTITVTVNGITSNSLNFYVRNTGSIYFVDHNNGNDNYNGRYSTFQSGTNGPRKTIPSARALLLGGDILYVRAGTYTEVDGYDSNLDLDGIAYGSNNSYSAVVGYPAEYPVLDCITNDLACIRNVYANTAYMTIAKMKLLPLSNGVRINTDNTGYLRFISLEIDGQEGGGGWIGAIDFEDCSNMVIYGCNIHNFGYDKYDHGIYVGSDGAANDVNYDIGWNEIHDLAYSKGTDGELAVSGIYIHPQDAGPKYADQIRIHDNLCYNLRHAGVHIASYIKGVDIWNNICYNCGSAYERAAIQFSTFSEVASNIKFYNNVIYSAANSALILFTGSSNVAMKNNLIYSLSGTPYYSDDGYSGSRSSDYDSYYGNGGPPSWATNALNLNPQFIDAANHDFHLQSNSPAIDVGTSAVSAVVLRDFDGNTRPQGAGFEIGAYEYLSSAPIHPADTNQNGKIEMTELIAFIGKWKSAQANLNDVMTALDRWFRGQ